MLQQGNSRASPSILVVDGDASSAMALANHFRRRGFWVYQTARADEALWLTRLHEPALAVIDLTLQDMPGCDLVLRFKLLGLEFPVIMTDGGNGIESETEARQAGIVYYAPKPIDLRWLDAVVTKAIMRLPRETRGGRRDD